MVSAVTKYFTPMDIQMIIISDKGGNDHSESEKKFKTQVTKIRIGLLNTFRTEILLQKEIALSNRCHSQLILD